MTQNRRIALNIIATYGRSLYALVIGLFCGRWTLMALYRGVVGTILILSVPMAVGLLPRLWMRPPFGRIVVTTVLVEMVMLALSWTLVLDAAEREFILNRFGKFLKVRK